MRIDKEREERKRENVLREERREEEEEEGWMRGEQRIAIKGIRMGNIEIKRGGREMRQKRREW